MSSYVLRTENSARPHEAVLTTPEVVVPTIPYNTNTPTVTNVGVTCCTHDDVPHAHKPYMLFTSKCYRKIYNTHAELIPHVPLETECSHNVYSKYVLYT